MVRGSPLDYGPAAPESRGLGTAIARTRVDAPPPACSPRPRMPAAPLALALALAAGPAARAGPPAAKPPPRDLAAALLAAVRAADLGALRDAGPDEGRCPGPACPAPLPRTGAVPHLEVAVIRLDARGRAVEAAAVLLSPDFPRGLAVRLDANLAPRGVRMRRWSLERREPGPVRPPPLGPADDLVPGQRGRDFMSPYPASLFKLPVAFHVLRRAGEGAFDLDAPWPAAEADGGALRPLSSWVERMITVSDNAATRAVLRFLHQRGELDRMNRGFEALGLGTLRVEGVDPETGARWAPGAVHAGAVDLARLLRLVAGGPGVLWRTPAGAKVTAALLPDDARARLLGWLSDQALHEVLSSASLCGRVPPGIPARVPEGWLDPETGLEVQGGLAFPHDARGCNALAEVEFRHKTGLTWNYAGDAGLVESLPGAPYRRYVVAVVSSAGRRWVDPELLPADPAAPLPCATDRICVTRRLARLGAAIDAYATAAARRDRRR